MLIAKIQTKAALSAIDVFMGRSSLTHVAKDAFLRDWAESRSSKEAFANACFYDGFTSVFEDAEYEAFEKMMIAVENEIMIKEFAIIALQHGDLP